jgi:hypothetical protein
VSALDAAGLLNDDDTRALKDALASLVGGVALYAGDDGRKALQAWLEVTPKAVLRDVVGAPTPEGGES